MFQMWVKTRVKVNILGFRNTHFFTNAVNDWCKIMSSVRKGAFRNPQSTFRNQKRFQIFNLFDLERFVSKIFSGKIKLP
jgi:hypothetical protein